MKKITARYILRTEDSVETLKWLVVPLGLALGVCVGIKVLVYPEVSWWVALMPVWIPMVVPIASVVAIAAFSILFMVGIAMWLFLVLAIGALIEAAFDANTWKK